jgi:hypothetical protein
MKTSFNCTFESSVVGMLLHTGLNILVVMHYMSMHTLLSDSSKILIRPHTNECSGSDLDGDVYFVCWDSDLIPPQKFPPMDYAAPQTTILDHDVTIEVTIQSCVLTFIKGVSLITSLQQAIIFNPLFQMLFPSFLIFA